VKKFRLPVTLITLFLFPAAACIAAQSASTASHPEVHALKITILSTMLADDGIGEWGFAALVEADGRKILFDTGARPNTVLENARELKLDLSDVQDVILSHFQPPPRTPRLHSPNLSRGNDRRRLRSQQRNQDRPHRLVILKQM
jgi:hypothetical protein